MPRARLALLPLLAALALAAGAAPLSAQQPERRITLRGASDQSRAGQIVHDVLARNNYLLIDHDTVLPASFHAPGDLVVADAEVRLEGAVEGSVAVVGGHLFLRPGSRVRGPIAVIDGGVYPSARATYDEIAEARTSTTVEVRVDSAARAEGREPGLTAEMTPPPGKKRFAIVPKPAPTYDRVNLLTVGAGIRYRLTDAYDHPPQLGAWATFRTGRRSLGGGARADLPLGRQMWLRAEASRATRTNDAWIASDLANSLTALLAGRDYRNYYESDRATLFLDRRSNEPLVAGESFLAPRVGVLLSRDRSLHTRDDPWSLFGRDELRRPNPPIDEGTLLSVVAGSAVELVGHTSRFHGDAQVEQGLDSGGDFAFTQLLVDGNWSGTTFRTHQLAVHFRGMAPLGGDAAPRQRWGILGGAGTLPTRDIGELRGDHLLFVESSYAIPIPRVDLPYIGQPSVELAHAAGTAWVTGDRMPRWVQNVGGGVRFPFFRAIVMVEPGAEKLSPAFTFGLTFAGI